MTQKLTVELLRAELRSRGLPTSGNKGALVARLRDMAGRAYYNNWTIGELKTELVTRQLPDTGSKLDLINRLKADDEKLSATRTGLTLTENFDIDRLIFIELNYRDSTALATVSRYAYGIGQSNELWRDKVISEFGVNLAGFVPAGDTFRQVYRELLAKTTPHQLLILSVARGFTPLVAKYLALVQSPTNLEGTGTEDENADEDEDESDTDPLRDRLVQAALFCRLDILELLLTEVGKRPNRKALLDGSVLVLGAVIRSGSPRVADLFIRAGTSVSALGGVFNGEMEYEYGVPVLKYLLEMGAPGTKLGSGQLVSGITKRIISREMDMYHCRQDFVHLADALTLLLGYGAPITMPDRYQEARRKLAYLGLTIPPGK